MHTSRFQLGLIVLLSMALGFSLSVSDASGYPVGTVSMGTNPAWSTAGELSGAGEPVIVTAPPDQDAMITDLHMATNHSNMDVNLVLGDGSLLGRYRLRNNDNMGGVSRSLTTGIRVPAGETLSLQWSSSHRVTYNFNGYFTRP